jgi:Putative amidase domain
MKKLLVAITVSITSLVFTAHVLTNTPSIGGTFNNQSPYPPPEITPTIISESNDPISIPYPEPIDLPVESPPQQIPYYDNKENTYSFFLPIIGKSYDRASAVNYADTWAHEPRNPNCPSFGTGCGCNDCTNYVSQVVHNGFYPLRTGNWDENSVFEWWYKKVLWWYESSKTWRATDWFNTYLFQYPNEFEFRSWPTELEAGDFFLMDLRGANPEDPPDGIPDHVRFVVGNGWTSTNQEDYTNGCGTNQTIPSSTYKLLINQHCVDRKHVVWNYGVQGGVGFWPFHVK